MEEAAAMAQRTAPYAFGGTAVAVLAAVGGLVGLSQHRRGSSLGVALAAGASVGLAWLAVRIVKRGLPRGVWGGVPPAEEVRAQMWRCMPRLLGGCAVALVGGLCGIAGLFRLHEGDLDAAASFAAICVVLSSLAVWIIRRVLPR